MWGFDGLQGPASIPKMTSATRATAFALGNNIVFLSWKGSKEARGMLNERIP